MSHTPNSSDATEALSRGPAQPLGIILRSPDAASHPSEMALEGGQSIIVGAGKTAQYVIEHPTVSRSHLELTVVPEGVRVRDLGSRNGTFYLGQRVETMTVQPGTHLMLGSVQLAIVPDLQALSAGDAEATSYDDLIGSSPSMRRLFATLARLEGALVNTLVVGPSGVGKELIAQALHRRSSVQRGPFVVQNCAAMNRELVQSQLFGHKKGAFTGAVDSREGAFLAAHKGTLFLDEIGELPLDVQPVLLRALEQGEVTPVGTNETRTVQVRVVAATNRDMEKEVEEGRFREDLFYRLAVVTLRVDPLAERPEDIEPLALKFARAAGMPELPREVLAKFRAHRWPGNARELRNAVQAYAALGNLLDLRAPKAGGGSVGSFADRVSFDEPFQVQKEAVVDEFTKYYLERLMERAGGNQSEAARISGIERSYLRKLLAKFGLVKG